MPEWPRVQLGQVAALNPEATPKWPAEHEIRYVDIASVSAETGIDQDVVVTYPFGQAPGRARRRIRRDDVLVSTVRPNLRAFAQVPPDLDGEVASTGFTILRAGQEVLPDFLWAVVRTQAFVESMVARCTGSNYPAIRPDDIATFEFSLPPIPQQRRIVDLVGACDVQIAAMRGELASLGVLALTQLNWMFVTFGSSSDGLEVPFESAIDFREGPGIMAVDFRDQGVPLIRLAGLTSGQSLLTKCNYLDPSKVDKKWGHFRVEIGDVLLSTSASLGRVAVVDTEAAGAVPYTGIIRMRPATKELDPRFIPWILRSPRFSEQVADAGVGTVMAHFGPSVLRP